MSRYVALTGNDAGAEALKDVNPDVAAVFPITPQTELMHQFSSYVNDGVVDTELIPVESEHSAQSACFGSAAAGARTSGRRVSEICCFTRSSRVWYRSISTPACLYASLLGDAEWLNSVASLSVHGKDQHAGPRLPRPDEEAQSSAADCVR